ncbi:aspartate aminotransferase family protein [Actinoplanes sp. NPDC049548]|uniref:aspartate aminotransferase family protein n=1 Tax=Actinoplanes sp. NPDC049548 TaxID=3155152 RepID=UPI003424382A
MTGVEAVSTRPGPGTSFVRATGPWLIDAAGLDHFDATSGSGAATLGHQHPAVISEVTAQLGALVHTGCKLGSAARERFVAALGAILPYADPAVLPTATGGEAVEAALKVARAATGGRAVVGFRYGYHGKTAGALALTWRQSFKDFSAPPDPSVLRAELPDPRGPVDLPAALDGFDRVLEQAAELGGLAAVVLEPVQVTEGVLAVPPELLDALAIRTRAAGGLFVLDEIYTGLGRCGQMFYGDLMTSPPDLTLLGKTLGNGFPIAAVTGERRILDVLPSGVQTSTFSGHPVSCAAATAVIETVLAADVPARAADLGERLAEDLAKLAARHPWLRGVRTVGALAAMDCADGDVPGSRLATAVAQGAADRRLLLFTGGPEGATIKIVPPVLLAETEYHQLLERLAGALLAAERDGIA